MEANLEIAERDTGPTKILRYDRTEEACDKIDRTGTNRKVRILRIERDGELRSSFDVMKWRERLQSSAHILVGNFVYDNDAFPASVCSRPEHGSIGIESAVIGSRSPYAGVGAANSKRYSWRPDG